MAIIDILTHYDAKKKAAHAAKTVKHGVSIGFDHNQMHVCVGPVVLSKNCLSFHLSIQRLRFIHELILCFSWLWKVHMTS